MVAWVLPKVLGLWSVNRERAKIKRFPKSLFLNYVASNTSSLSFKPLVPLVVNA